MCAHASLPAAGPCISAGSDSCVCEEHARSALSWHTLTFLSPLLLHTKPRWLTAELNGFSAHGRTRKNLSRSCSHECTNTLTPCVNTATWALLSQAFMPPWSFEESILQKQIVTLLMDFVINLCITTSSGWLADFSFLDKDVGQLICWAVNSYKVCHFCYMMGDIRLDKLVK